MGKSKPISAPCATRDEAFRSAVLRGAALLSPRSIRQLADDLHALARAPADEGRPATQFRDLEDDGSAVWL